MCLAYIKNTKLCGSLSISKVKSFLLPESNDVPKEKKRSACRAYFFLIGIIRSAFPSCLGCLKRLTKMNKSKLECFRAGRKLNSPFF